MTHRTVETSPQVLARIGGVLYLIFPAVLLPAFIGELSLCLWLIVKGVNVSKWRKQISMGRVSGASTNI
jgi:hypothetical protein